MYEITFIGSIPYSKTAKNDNELKEIIKEHYTIFKFTNVEDFEVTKDGKEFTESQFLDEMIEEIVREVEGFLDEHAIDCECAEGIRDNGYHYPINCEQCIELNKKVKLDTELERKYRET